MYLYSYNIVTSPLFFILPIDIFLNGVTDVKWFHLKLNFMHNRSEILNHNDIYTS